MTAITSRFEVFVRKIEEGDRLWQTIIQVVVVSPGPVPPVALRNSLLKK
jgi:hypothetical protein